jgi:hypothetical protein
MRSLIWTFVLGICATVLLMGGPWTAEARQRRKPRSGYYWIYPGYYGYSSGAKYSYHRTSKKRGMKKGSAYGRNRKGFRTYSYRIRPSTRYYNESNYPTPGVPPGFEKYGYNP